MQSLARPESSHGKEWPGRHRGPGSPRHTDHAQPAHRHRPGLGTSQRPAPRVEPEAREACAPRPTCQTGPRATTTSCLYLGR